MLAHARTRPRQILPPPLSSGCRRIGSECPVPGGDQAGTQAFLCFWEAERDRVSTKHSRVGVQIPAQPQDKGSSSPPAGALPWLGINPREVTGNHNGQNLNAATGVGVSCGGTRPREVKTVLGAGWPGQRGWQGRPRVSCRVRPFCPRRQETEGSICQRRRCFRGLRAG